jgi:hypothetical protein
MPTSDIDLIALGAHGPSRLVMLAGWQVSVGCCTSDEVRDSFRRLPGPPIGPEMV